MGLETRENVTPTVKNPFIFDTGNVRILVTYSNEQLVGKVSSDALFLASPVWKKFLFPPWVIQNTSDVVSEIAAEIGMKEIDCSEDDGEALLVLLNIAHLNFAAVPSKLPYNTLFHLALLVDQYQCIKLVQPWLKEWMINEGRESRLHGQEGWLFIAWVFGREDVFEALAMKLVPCLGIDSKGNFMRDLAYLRAEPMPDGIIESIAKVRLQTIERLLMIPYDITDRYEVQPYKGCDQSCIGDRELCDAVTYGSITLQLQRLKLWPRLRPEDIKVSIKDLVKMLLNIRIVKAPNNMVGYPNDHTQCCVKNFEGRVSRVLSTIESPVLESHRRHMRMQSGEAKSDVL